MKIKVMTYNIWNYNEPWDVRLKLICEVIDSEKPDIIGLQEVRFDERRNAEQDQAEQIAERVGMSYIYQPAHIYSEKPRVEEGLAIMAKHPFTPLGYIKLTRDPGDRRDAHQRICLGASVKVNGREIGFFVTHFSLSHQARVRNAVETVKYVAGFRHRVKVLVGDFNSPPVLAPIRLLKGEKEVDGVKGFFVDAWEAANPGDPGCTFPSRKPWIRLDYVFVSGEAKAIEAHLAGTKARKGVYPSDHLAIVATLEI